MAVFGFMTSPVLPSTAQTGFEYRQTGRIVGSAANPVAPAKEIVREFDDPATGTRWLLERDLRHPGGPGRMVPISTSKATGARSIYPEATRSQSVRPGYEIASPLPPPIIRAGDRLTVEEHSAIVDLSLEATALDSARPGTEFSARLRIGRRVVRALAVSSGRATLLPDSGVRP